MQGWVDQHPAIFVVFDVVFLLVVVFFIVSWWSGWALLARRFRAQEQFRGKRRWWVSGQMRWLAGYRNCLIIGANPEGLYLATLPFFSFFHPALFIPWTEIEVSDRRRFTLGSGSVRSNLGNDLRVPLTLYKLFGHIGDDLKRDAGAGWPAGLAVPHL